MSSPFSIKIVKKFKASEILNEKALERIRMNNALRFEEPLTCKCKCENGATFFAVITDEEDIEFYQKHNCNGEDVEFEYESKLETT